MFSSTLKLTVDPCKINYIGNLNRYLSASFAIEIFYLSSLPRSACKNGRRRLVVPWSSFCVSSPEGLHARGEPGARGARPTGGCGEPAARSARPGAWRRTPNGKGSPHSLTESTDPPTENTQISLLHNISHKND